MTRPILWLPWMRVRKQICPLLLSATAIGICSSSTAAIAASLMQTQIQFLSTSSLGRDTPSWDRSHLLHFHTTTFLQRRLCVRTVLRYDTICEHVTHAEKLTSSLRLCTVRKWQKERVYYVLCCGYMWNKIISVFVDVPTKIILPDIISNLFQKLIVAHRFNMFNVAAIILKYFQRLE